MAIVLAHGGTVRPRGTPVTPLSPATVAAIVREYEQEHLNTDTIAARHHLDPARVRRALEEAGVELRRYVLNQPAVLGGDERAVLAADYAAGATIEELKHRYRCGYPTVRSALAEHGVPVRPSPATPRRASGSDDGSPLSTDPTSAD